MAIKKGDKIKVDYEGSFEDGTVFDSSEKHGQPLEFEAGAGMVVPGFDDAVMGMEKGDEKEITLQPEKAYGQKNPRLIQKVPQEKLQGDEEIKLGMLLGVTTPQGQQIPAQVTEVTDTEITLDLNHPLAGKVLKFKIKIVEIA